MNRVLSTLNSIWGGLANGARTLAQQMSLVPAFLAHTLWLLSQDFRTLAKDGFGGNAAVYAVLTFLSTAVAEPTLMAYARQPDGTPGDALDWDHPLRKLIRAPNPFLTEYEFWELMTLHVGIAGRFTGWKERNILGQTMAIWPLRPDRVGPIYGKAEEGEPLIIGWSYQVPGTTRYIAIPYADVININFPNPIGESGGLVEGLGPLQALAAEVGADNEATRYVGALLANSAQPSVVLQVKGAVTTQEQGELIKAAFSRDFGGMRRGTPAVVDEGTTIASIGFNLQQLEFPNLRDITETRIAAAFHVPAVLVGLHAGVDAAIKATTEDLRASFAQNTLASYWRRYADAYTEQIAPEFGESIVCAFDLTKVAALAGLALARIDRIATAYAQGAVTVNEYREALDMEKRTGADVYMYGIAPGRGVGTPVPADPSTPDAPDDPDAGGEPVENPNPAPQTPTQQGQQTEAAKALSAANLHSALSGIQIYQGQRGIDAAFEELMAALDRGRQVPV